MWKATIRGILARKVRLALTALAVLLGVSFVTGTYVLGDTLDRSFRGIFRQSVSGIDLVVRQRAPFGGDTGRQRFPDSTVSRVRVVPGVASADGFVQGYAQFVDKSGSSIQTGGAPTLGISWSQSGDRGPLRLVDEGGRRSRAPRRPDEVAMDAGTASQFGFHVGDRVRVLLQGPAQEFRISGLFGFGDRRDIGAVTFAAFELSEAQRAFDARGLLDAINITAAPGTKVADLRSRLDAALGPSFEVSTAAQVAQDRGKLVINFLRLLTQLVLAFAVIGLIVGAFIIFNTFTILVTQRTREFGLLRAMGASGRQVVVSVVAEAGVIGALASAAGLALGLGLAAGLLALVKALGRTVPSGSLVLNQRTVIASFAVGVVATVASSLWPAVRAARVPPVAAIDDVVPGRSRPFHVRIVLGVLLALGGIPALVIGLDRTRNAPNVVDEIWLVALGAFLVFFGVIVLLAAFARPLAGLLGRPLRAVDVTGTLARGNAMRNPRRTAATASALVIGLGLVGLVAVFGDSAKASVRAAVERGIRADFVIKAEQFAGFSPQVEERIRAVPGVDAVEAFRFGNVRIANKEETVAGADPTSLGRVVDLRIRRGSLTGMGPDGLLVHADAAKEYHLVPGDTVEVQFPRGFAPLLVAGIYTQKDFTGGFPVPFIVAKPAYDIGFGTDQQDALVYVRSTGDSATVKHALQRSLNRDFPNIKVFTRSEYRDDQVRAIDRFLAVTIALLFLSELIAVLGIVNTLALSVYERTHELGLLRAVGMSRRQLRRMIRSESVVVALVGGLLGTAIGVFWGWAFTTALHSQGITRLSIPAVQVAVFLVLSMAAGVVAALGPAWRASRLDVLGAIATE